MRVNREFQVVRNKSDEIWYKYRDEDWEQVYDVTLKEYCNQLMKTYRSRFATDQDKNSDYEKVLKTLVDMGKISEEDDSLKEAAMRSILIRLINFFSEFSFVPNYRFTNTMMYVARSSSYAGVKEFVRNYFSLSDSPMTNSVVDKMESPEFKEIVQGFETFPRDPSKKINNRLKIYYGPQGTGKTTKAMEEAETVMVCHSAMLPSDLMEDFKFVEGKATFDPSALWLAMTNGQKIVLDEINLLPFESLRFLQSVLDGKTSFEYKGHKIEIADGFEVIGTMNLVVNGVPYPLPEPLVDRCEEIKEFGMTADALMNAIM